VRAPILRPDGTLLSAPGYDTETGLLLLADHPDGWPAIPERPTLRQVHEAVRTLWEPFSTLPFVSALDRSVQLAACLTSVQRPLLPTAPAFAWSAAKAGTGKTKAAKATGWLSGHEPIETPWSHDAEEQRKRITAKLITAPPSLLIDNVNGNMDSETLNVVLTSSTFEDRLLGTSQTVNASTRVLIMATGNNLAVVGDLSRRVLVATIDHGVENPERLAFDFCPVARMRERWLRYRSAALVILRGFIAAGMPAGGPGSMGSFEEWDALVRQCVVWLRDHEAAGFELADPADAVQKNYEADPETAKLSALIEALHAIFGEKPTTVKEMIRKAEQATDIAFGPSNPGADLQALEGALEEIAGEGRNINARRLGRWIDKFQNRILGGKRIVRAGKRSGVALWMVQAVQKG